MLEEITPRKLRVSLTPDGLSSMGVLAVVRSNPNEIETLFITR